MFGFWDWVGGRYSLPSAVGLSVMIAIGPEQFREMLAGYHAVDEHFRTAPLERNVPALLGLLNVWYDTFLGAQSHAVLPYSQYLHRFAAYLQQLTMESNGKSVRLDGTPVDVPDRRDRSGASRAPTASTPSTSCIHQGTKLIPADFIGVQRAQPRPRRRCTTCSCRTSSPRPARWPSAGPPRRSRPRAPTPDVAPHKVMPGNHPTTTILAPKLTPSTLGQLVALYEHITLHPGRDLGDQPVRPVGRRARQGDGQPAGAAADRRDARRPATTTRRPTP